MFRESVLDTRVSDIKPKEPRPFPNTCINNLFKWNSTIKYTS
jgi:hypothetical protein